METRTIYTELYKFYNTITTAFLEDNVIQYDKLGKALPVEFPYLTYTISINDDTSPTIQQIKIYTKGKGLNELISLGDKLGDIIGNGKFLWVEGGSILLRKGTPYSQPLSTDDDNIKGLFINLEMQKMF